MRLHNNRVQPKSCMSTINFFPLVYQSYQIKGQHFSLKNYFHTKAAIYRQNNRQGRVRKRTRVKWVCKTVKWIKWSREQHEHHTVHSKLNQCTATVFAAAAAASSDFDTLKTMCKTTGKSASPAPPRNGLMLATHV